MVNPIPSSHHSINSNSSNNSNSNNSSNNSNKTDPNSNSPNRRLCKVCNWLCAGLEGGGWGELCFSIFSCVQVYDDEY